MAKSGDEKDVLVTLTFDFPSAYVATGTKDSSAKDSAGSADTTGNSKTQGDGKSKSESEVPTKPNVSAPTAANSDAGKTTAPDASNGSNTGGSGSTQGTVGGTQSIVLPVFERMTKGKVLTLRAMSSGWVSLPAERPGNKIDNLVRTLPVTLNVVVKETDRGKGSSVWLSVADAISNNSATIASAILGKSANPTKADPKPAAASQ